MRKKSKRSLDFFPDLPYNHYMNRMGRFIKEKVKIMTGSKTAQAANYSEAQEAAIRAAAPLNLEKAKALGVEIGKSYRSVIAKAKNMGIDYEGKAKPAKRVGGMTKPEMVEAIQSATGSESLNGLEKATATALANLLASVNDAS